MFGAKRHCSNKGSLVKKLILGDGHKSVTSTSVAALDSRNQNNDKAYTVSVRWKEDSFSYLIQQIYMLTDGKSL